jgi:hypothetical protein
LLDDFLDLSSRDRKRKNANALDFYLGHRRFEIPTDEEVARPLHAGEQIFQRLQVMVVVNPDGDTCHAPILWDPIVE